MLAEGARTILRRRARIATVGRSGLTYGPHLYFGMIVNGRTVDPAPYLKVRLCGAEPASADRYSLRPYAIICRDINRTGRLGDDGQSGSMQSRLPSLSSRRLRRSRTWGAIWLDRCGSWRIASADPDPHSRRGEEPHAEPNGRLQYCRVPFFNLGKQKHSRRWVCPISLRGLDLMAGLPVGGHPTNLCKENSTFEVVWIACHQQLGRPRPGQLVQFQRQAKSARSGCGAFRQALAMHVAGALFVASCTQPACVGEERAGGESPVSRFQACRAKLSARALMGSASAAAT